VTASPGRRANALDAAVAAAPESPGVYVFLGEDLELLYVGKAANLRRRVRQHARASPNEADRRVAALYGSTREVRWMLCPTETAAAALEADLIVSLQPTFNAAHAAGGRWTLVVVGGAGPGSDHVRFELVADDGGGRGGGRRQAGRQVYGCFPAPASPPGRASPAATATPPSFGSCGRQGPTAADGGPVPPRLASGSPPPSFDVPVPAGLRGGIDKFLSGRSGRVLEGLAAASQADRYLRPALARDRRSAQSFFDFGPAPLRRLRLRHALRPGPLSRQTIVDLLEAEVREAIGDFRSPAVPDPTGGVLGRRDTTTRRIAASVRRHTSSPPFGTAGQ